MSQDNAVWQLPTVQEPVFKKDTFSILTYHAVGDGVTLNTQALQRAIHDCHAKGGGVVLVPNGLWLTGPLVLESHVNLHLEANATLLFTSDKSQYRLVESNWEGLPAVRNQSPLSGTNLQNIAITGKGIIDGNGDAWRAVKKDKLTESQWRTLVASGGLVDEQTRTWYPSASFFKASQLEKPGVLEDGKTLQDFAAYKDFFRPNLLVFNGCKNVLLDGPTFQNAAAWGVHTLLCEHLTVRNVSVKNPWYAQNGDGIDVESCSNVLIENSTFDVGDDGICIKSGRDEAGRKRGTPTKDLVVRNCVVYHAHGGFVIGSEMSGGVRNLFVENCTFIGTDIGLRFKTKRGRGGTVENIFVRHISMKDIVGEAILFDMYYMAKDPVLLAGEAREVPQTEVHPVTEATPRFQNFHIDHVYCQGAARAMLIRGLPEMPIQDIHIGHTVIRSKKGIQIKDAQRITFDQVQVACMETQPVFSIENAKDVVVDGFRCPEPIEVLMTVSGKESSGIKVLHTDTTKAKLKFKLIDHASPKAVEFKP